MINIVTYLEMAHNQNIDISPIVRDLLERYKSDELTFDGIELLDNTRIKYIIKAFKFCEMDHSKTILLKLLKNFSISKNVDVVRYIIMALGTIPFRNNEDKLLLFKYYIDTLEIFETLLDLCTVSFMTSCYYHEEDTDKEKVSKEVIKAFETRNIKEIIELNSEFYSEVVICQIADLHFGIFNNQRIEPHGPQEYMGPTQDIASFLFRKNIYPDYFIVCGDIASNTPDDFRFFEKFVDTIKERGRKNAIVIVVPGNHDNFWSGSKNDRLKAFEEFILKLDVISPYRKNGNEKNAIYQITYDGCPSSIFVDYERNLLFLLLISTMYTGEISEDINKELVGKGVVDTDGELFNRMRLEHGYFHGNYINLIEKMIFDCKNNIGEEVYKRMNKMCVTHHHFDAVYEEEKPTIGGEKIRKLLKMNGINVIFHGHIHKMVDSPYHVKNSFCIPCPSLSGKVNADKNGFNIIRLRDNKMCNTGETYYYHDSMFEEDFVPFEIPDFA